MEGFFEDGGIARGVICKKRIVEARWQSQAFYTKLTSFQ